ncbi:MAG: hypothetical protein GF334_00420 [Candidatus Altiarchaeales archaeon]|nr:hypothetical protein [Candidatus Altiarchaeales archaeon]
MREELIADLVIGEAEAMTANVLNICEVVEFLLSAGWTKEDILAWMFQEEACDDGIDNSKNNDSLHSPNDCTCAGETWIDGTL